MEFDTAIAVAVIVAAPVIGSFLAVVALRWGSGRTVVFGRSACDACGHALGPLELVPLVSYAAQRGRCRHCGAAIDPLHAVMEAGALMLAVWAAFVTSGWVLLASAALGWTLLTLSAIDWRTGLLPDILTLPLIAAGLGVAWLVDPKSLLDHVIGAVVGFVVFAALSEIYLRLRGRDGLGLGDAKLLAASGAWLGWQALPSVILFAALLGLAAVLVLRVAGKHLDATSRIAFGPALAAATWAVWLYGPLVPG
jgi:leader peptidase (prepilin peptidase)/N-methyltransferase